jgi:hypothetical protein
VGAKERKKGWPQKHGDTEKQGRQEGDKSKDGGSSHE